MPRTIRGLAGTFAGLAGSITVLLGGATYAVVHEEIERQIDQRVEAESQALIDYTRDHGFAALLAVVDIRERRIAPGNIGYLSGVDDDVGRAVGYIVVDRSGRRRGGALRAEMPPPGWSEFVHFVRRDGSTGIAQGMNSALPGGGRLVAADREIVDEIDRLLLRIFAIGFGLTFLIGGLALLGFGRIVRRRLQAIETSADAIIAGDMSQRMPLDGSGAELDRLAIVLNRMLDRIAALVENLREVSNDLAHDLRTPLSRLRARLERAEAMAADPPLRGQLESAIDEADALLRLFSSLLAIAAIDGRGASGRFAPLDLGDAARSIADAYRPAIEDAGMTIAVHAGTVFVHGDRPLLQQLVGNLLDNVLHHTPAGTAIRLSVEARDGRAVLRIADDGPGIPERDRERIFQRLVRLDASRSTPGHGLGLSIVAAIASAHGGTVRALPGDPGMVAEFAMPALADQAARA